jgi:DNA/RNA-binding domain of Phe-tRNA-synthetase-like protein
MWRGLNRATFIWRIELPFVPQVAPAKWSIAPGFRAFSLRVKRDPGPPENTAVAARALEEAIAIVQAGQPAWAKSHLDSWANVFRNFGAKPQRTACAAQALRERVLKTGTLGAIDPVVDLYNAISLKYAVPVGGENVSAYRGNPHLVVAAGDEEFDTSKNGEPATEQPDRGEVVWRDDIGVTCRRWNWRQGVRTRIHAETTDMWFVIESLPEMPLLAFEDAGRELLSGLNQIFRGVTFETNLLQQELDRCICPPLFQ